MNEDYEAILHRLDTIEEDIKQSNHMLHRIERRARWSLLFSSLKWFVIIGLSLGTFYYTKPYLEQLMETYSQVSNFGSFLK
ncbi:hypothetical protein H7Y21_03770 [Arenimonas sp.]|nr:hypothetical protein [Candidatus Parcubacteria bacterium]